MANFELFKDLNPAIEESLKKTEKAEDIIAIIKAEGKEISLADAEEIWNNIQDVRANQQKTSQLKENSENLAVDGSELSVDELEAISGGRGSDFLHYGCNATVEYGSSCFLGEDACSFSFYYYGYLPVEMKCPECGGTGADSMTYTNIAYCKKCHRSYNYVTGEYDPLNAYISF